MRIRCMWAERGEQKPAMDKNIELGHPTGLLHRPACSGIMPQFYRFLEQQDLQMATGRVILRELWTLLPEGWEAQECQTQSIYYLICPQDFLEGFVDLGKRWSIFCCTFPAVQHDGIPYETWRIARCNYYRIEHWIASFCKFPKPQYSWSKTCTGYVGYPLNIKAAKPAIGRLFVLLEILP